MSERQLLLDKRSAAASSISLRTVDYLIADGKLRLRRVGRRVLIHRAEIARFAGQSGQCGKGRQPAR